MKTNGQKFTIYLVMKRMCHPPFCNVAIDPNIHSQHNRRVVWINFEGNNNFKPRAVPRPLGIQNQLPGHRGVGSDGAHLFKAL